MIKVAQWGFGAMGSGMVRLVLERGDLELVGVISQRQEFRGQDVGEVLQLGRKTGALMTDEPTDILRIKPDVILHATGSFVDEIFPILKQIMEAGSSCISIAEELAYPWRSHPEQSRDLDAIARQCGVSLLGTGVNPGFVLDTLILALTGVCANVHKISATRVNDLSPFGPSVMRTQGVGTSIEEFESGLLSGEIVGHIGFQQSIAMIAAGLGWELDDIVEKREPIISKTHRETEYVSVMPGMVAGCKHSGIGIMDRQAVIELMHPQQIRPELEGIETGDSITIDGDININLTNSPEIPGGLATINITVNMIHQLIAAAPGLVTMLDLPLPVCRH